MLEDTNSLDGAHLILKDASFPRKFTSMVFYIVFIWHWSALKHYAMYYQNEW